MTASENQTDSRQALVKPTDWPHSEVGRFHHTLALCATAVPVALAAAETVRHRRPAEVAVLLGAILPHVLLGTWLLRRLREAAAAELTITGESK